MQPPQDLPPDLQALIEKRLESTDRRGGSRRKPDVDAAEAEEGVLGAEERRTQATRRKQSRRAEDE